jgi:malate dehydrogenase (oxaloacetate-decarboxylating)(NADP+)
MPARRARAAAAAAVGGGGVWSCSGGEFDSFMREVMEALKAWQPHLLVQFEDFGNNNAFRLLDEYRHKMCAFNDDIQGTACITLAGLLSAARATGKPFSEHRVLFLGAGEAGTGIGELIAQYLHRWVDH